MNEVILLCVSSHGSHWLQSNSSQKVSHTLSLQITELEESQKELPGQTLHGNQCSELVSDPIKHTFIFSFDSCCFNKTVTRKLLSVLGMEWAKA